MGDILKNIGTFANNLGSRVSSFFNPPTQPKQIPKVAPQVSAYQQQQAKLDAMQKQLTPFYSQALSNGNLIDNYVTGKYDFPGGPYNVNMVGNGNQNMPSPTSNIATNNSVDKSLNPHASQMPINNAPTMAEAYQLLNVWKNMIGQGGGYQAPQQPPVDLTPYSNDVTGASQASQDRMNNESLLKSYMANA